VKPIEPRDDRPVIDKSGLAASTWHTIDVTSYLKFAGETKALLLKLRDPGTSGHSCYARPTGTVVSNNCWLFSAGDNYGHRTVVVNLNASNQFDIYFTTTGFQYSILAEMGGDSYVKMGTNGGGVEAPQPAGGVSSFTDWDLTASVNVADRGNVEGFLCQAYAVIGKAAFRPNGSTWNMSPLVSAFYPTNSFLVASDAGDVIERYIYSHIPQKQPIVHSTFGVALGYFISGVNQDNSILHVVDPDTTDRVLGLMTNWTTLDLTADVGSNCRAVWYGINENYSEPMSGYITIYGGLRRAGSTEAQDWYGSNWTGHVVSYVLYTDSGNNIEAQMGETAWNTNQGTLWAWVEDTARVRRFKAGRNITKNKKVVHKGV